MRVSLVFFFFMLPMIGNAATWKPISSANENGTRFYVDIDSINDEGKFTRAWVMENRREKKKIMLEGKNIRYTSYVSLHVFDCERKQGAIVQGTFYSEKFAKGEVLNSFTEKLDNSLFSVKAPSTMGEALLEYVCDKQTPRKIQT